MAEEFAAFGLTALMMAVIVVGLIASAKGLDLTSGRLPWRNAEPQLMRAVDDEEE